MGFFIDLLGQRFGRLTVIERIPNDKLGKAMWICRCDCGTERSVRANCLREGDTRSCGCHQREVRAAMLAASAADRRTHGGTPKRLYQTWKGMKGRCYNEKNQNYASYGGRGITICNEWRYDFPVFRAWALASGYAPRLTIERIDNDLGYSPANCRWATRLEQGQNRRSTVYLTINGLTLSISEHARRNNMPRGTLRSRWVSGKRGEELISTTRTQR